MNSWITDVVSSLGLAGIAALMFLENVFPPIPSELIMPLAGYLSTTGAIAFTPAVIAGSIGSLAGATFWYWIGLRFSGERFRSFIDRHGLWLALDLDDYDRACMWFERHGGKAVFFGRMIPAVRTLISVPAGLSRMPFMTFILWTALGTTIWVFLLTLAGWFLGSSFSEIGRWIDPISTAVLVIMVAAYLLAVLRKLRKRRRSR